MKLITMTAAVAAALALGPAAARAMTISQEADVAVQQKFERTFNGAPSQRFEEYGEKPSGLILERYRLGLDSDNYFMDVEARQLGKNDQSVKGEGGQPGRMTWKLGWDQTPHLFSNEARSLWKDQGGGNLSLPTGLQQLWQNADPGAGFTAPSNFNSFTSTGVRAALNAAPYVPLGFKTETGNIDLRFHPATDLTMSAGAWRQTKRGTKALAGSFGFNAAIELPAPVDYETDEAYLDLGLAKKDYQLGFNYRYSQFQDRVYNLVWDNPRRVIDRYVSGSSYIYGDGSARGGLAQAPNNKANSLTLSGGADLPFGSRVSAQAGYQLWTALNPMMPFTVNSAITPANAAAAGLAAVNTPPFDASDPNNRPDPNVQGKIEVYTQSYRLSSRPLSWLRGALSYDSYIMENKSKTYNMPGFVRFDQVWEDGAIANDEHHQLRTDKTALKLDYDVNSWLSGDLGLSHKYVKQLREVDKSHEDEQTVGFTVRPSRRLFANASYTQARRRMEGFVDSHYRNDDTGAFEELPGLRRSDVADRNLSQGRVQVQWTPGEASYGLSARVTQDLYQPGQGQLNGGDVRQQDKQYGMLRDLQQALGTDVSVPLGERVTADAYYEFDFTRRVIRSNLGSSAVNACGNLLCQNPEDDWTARVTENTHAAGLTLTWLPLQRLKTVFGYDVISTRANSDPLELGANAAAFQPQQTARRMTQTLKASGDYGLTKTLTVGARYLYQKFDVSDYATGNVPLRSVNNDAIYLGASLRNYYAHLVSMNLSYKF